MHSTRRKKSGGCYLTYVEKFFCVATCGTSRRIVVFVTVAKKRQRYKRHVPLEVVREKCRVSVGHRWRKRGASKAMAAMFGRVWELYYEEARRLKRELPTFKERVARGWELWHAEQTQQRGGSA